MTVCEPQADLFDRYSAAETFDEAEAALEELARLPDAGALEIGEYFDELATLAAEEEDFAVAIHAQRRGLELGIRHERLGREMLAWYLLKDGQMVAGEADFSALRWELGEDPHLLTTLGAARSDAGMEKAALAAFDDALAAAKERDDQDAIDQARIERKESREALGLEPDADDLQVKPRPGLRRFEGVRLAVGYFPPAEQAAALDRWPELADDLTDPRAYACRIERHLREAQDAAGQRPAVAPLDVEGLTRYADEWGLDPATADARAAFAADLHRRGVALAWPPGRNDPCWCGSGRKYKRCCTQA